MINYFNFKAFRDRYLLTNDFGDYLFATGDELQALLSDSVDYQSDFGIIAKSKSFCSDQSLQRFSEEAMYRYRDAKSYLFHSTSLHIFVVTTACNMQCVYCQAQNGTSIPQGMMSKDVAKRSVDIALSSPEQNLSFEFQGGEPLLNFEIIKFIVSYTEEHKGTKKIQYNIVTNLTLLTVEMLDFIVNNRVGISTSIDGPSIIHDANRIFRNGKGTFASVSESIALLKRSKVPFGAIETTTRYSLPYAQEIVDAYEEMGLDNLFVRPLTPLGCAQKDWERIGYTPEEFLQFYSACFDAIIKKNQEGVFFKEGHAALLLPKILTGSAINYMELRSPCGASVGQIAYYYDGNVYTCDEGRMLAEMGDSAFCLGNVYDCSYSDLMESSACRAACTASLLESIPNCADCVYQPYCGTCPVVNYSETGNVIPNRPGDYKCKIYMGMLDIIFVALMDQTKKQILESWIY